MLFVARLLYDCHTRRRLVIMTCHAVFTGLMMLHIRENFHLSFVLAEASCPPPPSKVDAKQFNESLRYPKGCVIEYACREGYVRKGGTSRMSVCEEEDGKLVWKDKGTPLECKAKPNAKGDDPKLCPEIFRTTTTPSIPTGTVQLEKDLWTPERKDPKLFPEIFRTMTTPSIPTGTGQLEKHLWKPEKKGLIGLALLSSLVLTVLIGVQLKKQRDIHTAQEEEEPRSSVEEC